MKKIEIIWRELLYAAIEKKNLPAGKADRQFTQKELAENFGFSTSTVFQALKIPRKMGAVRVSGRFFILEDSEKLLYYWASIRNLEGDIRLSVHVDLPVFELESRMPPDVVFGGFTAAREILKGQVPADYDKVYVYSTKVEEIEKRFNFGRGKPNLFILKGDKFLDSYGQMTTYAHTFVDLWNMSAWYAKEFANSLKEKIDELLP